MKKVFLIAAVMFAAVSCLNSKYETSYPLLVSFEQYYVSELFPNDEQVFFRNRFYYGDVDFYNTRDTVKVNGKDSVRFTGGVGIGHVSDTTIILRKEPYTHFTVYDEDILKKKGVNNFGILFDNGDKNPAYPVMFPFASYGAITMASCYFCNTTENIATVLGLSDKDAFTDGDWLRLTLTGWKFSNLTDPAKETASVEIYLADYRSGRRECLREWKSFDLSALGSIHYMTYKIESSSSEIEPYVCFDDLALTVSIARND